MITLKYILFLILISNITLFSLPSSALTKFNIETASEIQTNEVRKLSSRLLGKFSKRVSIAVDFSLISEGKDTFKIVKNSEQILTILGSSGVAAAWGLHYYLKNFCNVHISWEGSQLELPNTFPDVNLTITANDKFRYYQNVCLGGYSTVWWQWEQWERHIDWMALNGINLSLAFAGQEAIWQRVYMEMNLTLEEINEHFGGPAFLPWSRMGNIRGWGGPLTSSWHTFTIKLQHKILNRMRNLGMRSVLPAFSGQVPRALAKHFPNATMTKMSEWNTFQDRYCCPLMLEPADPLFQILGTDFLRKYIEEFGSDHIYNCDAFNENKPSSGNLTYLSNIGKAIFKALTTVDSEAIWLLQGWMFVNDFQFWTESRVRAFVTSVPTGKMIILDLQSEQFPQYKRLKSYFGQPFIWCMLHNFGGTLGMFGSSEIINERVFESRKFNGSTMIGVGLTPEGINQNYVIYELMMEMGYHKKPVNLEAWFENYASRRYGAWNEYTTDAWKKLGKSVYNFSGSQRIRGHYVITRKPSLKIKVWTWYDYNVILSAWDMLLMGRHNRGSSSLYKHDLVDVTRQVLQVKADTIYLKILEAYTKSNKLDLKFHSSMLLELFDDLERILASHENFLLGVWLKDAKSLGTNEMEILNYEYNAKNQITLWGPNGEIIDYANKQWSGIIEDYFKPRWKLFLETLYTSLNEGINFNQTDCNLRMFNQVEQPFTLSNKTYSSESIGNSIELALGIHSKWRYLYI
ncbi:alpha-N-acetylglucosaminidase [Leptopilina heterotoma]|uniref:alpha-N-acetylglucosaminidase n=1 Tax=Leptopilina heterotoma TaxID=63436 RepID=UPI001CA92AFC|nr:alpha-N-acetylglucosaminidase [Leptopilina heterotoma]